MFLDKLVAGTTLHNHLGYLKAGLWCVLKKKKKKKEKEKKTGIAAGLPGQEKQCLEFA